MDIVNFKGIQALANCNWVNLTSNISQKKLGIRFNGAFVDVDNFNLLEKPSLLSLIVAPFFKEIEDIVTIVIYADSDSKIFFGAVINEGKPALEKEKSFKSREKLVEWGNTQIKSFSIDGVILSKDLITDIKESKKAKCHIISSEKTLENFDFTRVAKVTGSASKIKTWFSTLKRKSKILGAMLLIFSIGFGFFYYKIDKLKTEEELTKILNIKYIARNEFIFLENCSKAFAEMWDVASGWSLTSKGCTTPGMEGHNTSQPAHAYMNFRLNSGVDGAIARAAAELVAQESDYTLSIENDYLTLKKPINIEMSEFDEQIKAPTTDAKTLIERAFLGISRNVEASGNMTRLTMWGDFASAITPLKNLSWVKINSISKSAEGLINIEIVQKVGSPKKFHGETL